MEKAKKNGTTEIRKEMITMKEDIVKETRQYANIVQVQASKTMGIQLSLFKKQLATTMQYIDNAEERSEAFAIEGNRDLLN